MEKGNMCVISSLCEKSNSDKISLELTSVSFDIPGSTFIFKDDKYEYVSNLCGDILI